MNRIWSWFRIISLRSLFSSLLILAYGLHLSAPYEFLYKILNQLQKLLHIIRVLCLLVAHESVTDKKTHKACCQTFFILHKADNEFITVMRISFSVESITGLIQSYCIFMKYFIFGHVFQHALIKGNKYWKSQFIKISNNIQTKPNLSFIMVSQERKGYCFL